MRRRPFLSLVCLLALAGCADAPGMKKPLPLNFEEQTQAVTIYRRVGPAIAKYDGVMGTYLTSTNNPRMIVVVVRDQTTIENLEKIFHTSADGLPIRYEIGEKGWEPEDGPIEAVKKEDLPQTWWDKVVYYLKHFAYRVMPSDVAKPDAAPATPAAPDPMLKNI